MAEPTDNVAQSSLTVIELFTSQGCSSCPPADAALKTLAEKPNILALSWPVDYWDRLGWEDTFADPFNAKRQAAYNKRLGRGGVFTPQMIFNGRVQCVGNSREKIRIAMEKVAGVDQPTINPEIMLEGSTLTLSLPESGQKGASVALRVVWYQSHATVQIGDGENQGRILHYTNVVRATEMLDDWDGSAQFVGLASLADRPEGADKIAVILHSDYGHGPIVGAASFALPDNSL